MGSGKSAIQHGETWTYSYLESVKELKKNYTKYEWDKFSFDLRRMGYVNHEWKLSRDFYPVTESFFFSLFLSILPLFDA